MTTLHQLRTFDIDAAASANDGYHGVDVLPLTIVVEGRAVTMTEHDTPATLVAGPTDEQFDRMAAWLAAHIEGRDLTGTLHFPPTAKNIALYLSRVFGGLSPDVYRVSVADRDSTFTVTLHDN